MELVVLIDGKISYSNSEPHWFVGSAEDLIRKVKEALAKVDQLRVGARVGLYVNKNGMQHIIGSYRHDRRH